MTFVPVLPISGLAGWEFLKRTDRLQRDAFEGSTTIKNDVDHFVENFPRINSSDELLDDRRLLSVALGAFGLEEDINNKFFIKRIIDDGTTDSTALSNVLADKRYRDLAAAFENADRFTQPIEFAKRIANKFVSQSFETAVGEQNNDFRLALNLTRKFAEISDRDTSNDTKWFSIMGNPPLRAIFEGALRLPSSIGSAPIDSQLNFFRDRARSILGTDDVSELATSQKQEEVIRNFLLQKQVSSSIASSPSATALVLLQNSNQSLSLF